MEINQSKKNPDLVVQCRKCGHQVFVTHPGIIGKIPELLDSECPNCGEVFFKNWIIVGFGSFSKFEADSPDRILK